MSVKMEMKLEMKLESGFKIDPDESLKFDPNQPSASHILRLLETAADHRNMNFVVRPQRGATQQITNRNYVFEDQLKTLSEKMLEIFEGKPDPGQDFANLKEPAGKLSFFKK